MARKPSDLTGRKFGHWTAIKIVPSDTKATWLCRCDCGTLRNVRGDMLLAGRTRSCGCRTGFRGCDEDCFNCKYEDCLKPYQ